MSFIFRSRFLSRGQACSETWLTSLTQPASPSRIAANRASSTSPLCLAHTAPITGLKLQRLTAPFWLKSSKLQNASFFTSSELRLPRPKSSWPLCSTASLAEIYSRRQEVSQDGRKLVPRGTFRVIGVGFVRRKGMEWNGMIEACSL